MSKEICTSCKQELKPVFENFPFTFHKLLQIDSGISFVIHGGYGEFFDSPFEKDGYEEPSEFNLCHDCAVKVFEILDPELRFKGGHPTINEDDSRCCKWCWTEEDVGIIMDNYRENRSLSKLIIEERLSEEESNG